MKYNIGNTDKFIRVAIGIAIFGAGFYFRSWWGLVGLIPLLTAFVGFCPLYKVLGVSTNKQVKRT